MCGITGYVGARPAVATALNNLKRLEYRGYDSAGVAFPNCTQVRIVRAAGKIVNLERALEGLSLTATVAIAHTRWATHGRPTEANAHPHRDYRWSATLYQVKPQWEATRPKTSAAIIPSSASRR